MKRFVAIALSVFLAAPAAHADSWSYPRKVQRAKFVFGSTRVALTMNARKNSKYPDFLLEIFKDGKQVARVPGVHFEKLFASKDRLVFVGLSNRGIPGTAAVVFTHDGVITLLAQHGLAEFDYCSKSITLERVWFDEENPEVRFQMGDQEPTPGIFLRSCSGQEIELIKTIQDAYAKAAKGKK
jgi:hypothetical protein